MAWHGTKYLTITTSFLYVHWTTYGSLLTACRLDEINLSTFRAQHNTHFSHQSYAFPQAHSANANSSNFKWDLISLRNCFRDGISSRRFKAWMESEKKIKKYLWDSIVYTCSAFTLNGLKLRLNINISAIKLSAVYITRKHKKIFQSNMPYSTILGTFLLLFCFLPEFGLFTAD